MPTADATMTTVRFFISSPHLPFPALNNLALRDAFYNSAKILFLQLLSEDMKL